MSFLIPELLDWMLGHPDTSYVVLSLWKCGNRNLQQKLAQGITELHLSHVKGLKSEFPRCLSKFTNLRHLSIKSKDLLMEIPMAWKIELSKLSRKLEVLDIECRDALYALLNTSPASTKDNLDLIQTDRYGRGDTHWIDIGQLFPRLHTLRVIGPKNAPSLISHDFAGLPNTVTHLSCGKIVKDAADYWLMALLPRSLRVLDADVVVNMDPPDIFEPATKLLNDWSKAPPHLERIKSVTMVHTDTTAWLPRSLTSCALRWEVLYQCFTPTSLGSLPPPLRSLALTNVVPNTPSEWCPHLPQKLTELQLGPRVLQPVSMFSLLPKTLEILILERSIDWFGLSQAFEASENDVEAQNQLWPPLLNTLKIAAASVSSGLVCSLPRTLTNLDIQLKSTLRDDEPVPSDLNCSLLPPHLTSLSITNEIGTSIQFVMTETLPPCLEFLILRMGRAEMEVAPELLASLPVSLKTLHLYGNEELMLEQPLKLPPGLLEFKWDYWKSSWFSSIPPTVTHLALYKVHFSGQPSDSDIFEGLPSRLYNLVLNSGNSPRPSFSGPLPSLLAMYRLKELEVAVTLPQLLKYLPKTLKCLSFKPEAIDHDDIQFLPPSLIEIAPSSAFIWNSPQIAEHWPLGLIDEVPTKFKETHAALEARRKTLYH